MLKSRLLPLILCVATIAQQPITARASRRAGPSLLNNLMLFTAIGVGTMAGWRFWDWNSRGYQVEEDKDYLANVRRLLLNIRGDWFEDHHPGHVDYSSRFWIHWRTKKRAGFNELVWGNAQELHAAENEAVLAELVQDLKASRISFGKSLLKQDLKNDRYARIYYDMSVEIRALKEHMGKILEKIVKYTQPEYLDEDDLTDTKRTLRSYIKEAALVIDNQTHKRVRDSATTLRELTLVQLEQIKQSYLAALKIESVGWTDLLSWGYSQERENCKLAILYHWKLMLVWARLYTLRQIVASKVTPGLKRESDDHLFGTRIKVLDQVRYRVPMLSPYGFTRLDYEEIAD